MPTSSNDEPVRQPRRADTLTVALWGLYWLAVCAYALKRSADEGANAWVWVVPALVAVGPLVALLMLTPGARRRREYVRMFLSALAVATITFIGLMQGEASLQVALFVGLLGPAWGIWRVHRIDEQQIEAALERERLVAQERHEELLRAVREQRASGRRVAGQHRRYPGRAQLQEGIDRPL